MQEHTSKTARAVGIVKSALYGMVWYGMVWYGMVWYGMVWYDMAWYGMVWYGTVWYGMVRYGMVWCDVVWYGAKREHLRHSNKEQQDIPPQRDTTVCWKYWCTYHSACISLGY